MGPLLRQVAIASLVAAAAAACGSSDEPASPPSPCKAFPKPPAPALVFEAIPGPGIGGAKRAAFGREKTWVLDKTGAVTAIEAGVSRLPVGPFLDIAAIGDALFGAKPSARGLDVVRVDGAAETPVASVDLAAPAAGASMVPTSDGRLLVGAVDRLVLVDPASAGEPSPFAQGLTAVVAVAFDRATSEAFVVDRTARGDVLHRLRAPGGVRDGAPPLDLPDALSSGSAAVVRDGRSGALEGRFVYGAATAIVVVDPFGPSGPGVATPFPAEGATVLGNDADGAALTMGAGMARLADGAPASAPKTLGATGCLEVAAAAGYDVAVPLWSDGAGKSRAIVLPPDGRARVMPDGDLKFPVGTVAVKTFARGGRRIETRLFVQHGVEDWAGYSYAWNAEGTDAELVTGSAVRDGWYFPSASDCNACHTPAAGYTLGLEARQLDDAAKARLGVAFDGARFDPTDARAYLHANCAPCHREGSATGLAELDLRFDTPLDRTGLCGEPRAGALGIDGARIVAPGAPERSVLVRRMRALDETRMPKLGTHVVDEAGAALVESWVLGLASCP